MFHGAISVPSSASVPALSLSSFFCFLCFFLQDHYHRRAIAVSFWAAFGAPKAGKGNRNCVLMALASLLVGQLERVFGSVVIV